ncbi:MAG TPA: M1 family metallopeptidase [Gemmatimonadaceae bacterium]|nr:M1 family metallopeptidase [Gemmatimonadaceae bacterium]
MRTPLSFDAARAHTRLVVLAAAAATALAIAAHPALAQQQSLPPEVAGDPSIFAPLPLPRPNEYRMADGRPGPRYWQNRADYDIRATLDTATKTLRGHLVLRYTNHSPAALDHIWLQLEQNAFRPNAMSRLLHGSDSRFGVDQADGGDVIEHVQQLVGKKLVALDTVVNGTMMRVALAAPLPSGGTATLNIAWHFQVPVHGADRMGRDGSLYELAQWYPRVAVYDDVRGWNTDPYLGQGEFYLEYGDFTYAVTVPAGYIVAGTGVLDNPREVLTPTQIARLAKAAKSDSVVRIVTKAELESGAARPRATGTLTWRFSAKNVRDVAWTGAPDYLWDASSWRGILAQAYYRPSAADLWNDAADQARMSIMEYSERWYRYPYPQISAVEGPVSGMEYPMLAMEAQWKTARELYNVVTHEIGHNWFPMIVGSNERLHGWMDEGFNTFINAFSENRRFADRHPEVENRETTEKGLTVGVTEPVDVPPDRIPGQLVGYTQYTKPAAALRLLRDEILGPAVFDSAFRAYIARWAFKHPTPADFYRTMEDVSGRRLDWFWREFFVDGDRFDQGIDTAFVRVQGADSIFIVAIGNHARGVLPVYLHITYSDSTTSDFHVPAEVWGAVGPRFVHGFIVKGKQVVKLELDPDHHLIDSNRANDVWHAPPSSGGSPNVGS